MDRAGQSSDCTWQPMDPAEQSTDCAGQSVDQTVPPSTDWDRLPALGSCSP